jgi:hypothetical protein
VNPSPGLVGLDICKFDIAPFLQQDSHVKCHPAAGGIPGNAIGADIKTHSSTAPSVPKAQSNAELLLFIGSHTGDISEVELRVKGIEVIVG